MIMEILHTCLNTDNSNKIPTQNTAKIYFKKETSITFFDIYKSVCGLHTYIYVEKKVLGGPDSLLLKNGGC